MSRRFRPGRVGLGLLVAALSSSHLEGLDLREKIEPLARPLIDEGVAVGFVVGIARGGETQILAYGETAKGSDVAPDGDTIYEIGSITKVFTAVLLADMVERGLVELEDPIQRYVPRGVRVPTAGEQPITLARLATHTSGLPRLPDNLEPGLPSDPYAGYTAREMYAFLDRHELRRPPGEYEYSNYGAGLLGHLLARRARRTYAELVRGLTTRLGMKDTVIELDPGMQRRLAPPYNAALERDHNWHFRALAGAGAIRSTVRDLLRFIGANLASDDSKLTKALRLTHRRRHTMDDGQAVGLGWHIARDGITRYHNGMTGGYHGWIAVVPGQGIGVVVLGNTATGRISQLGQQVTRLALAIAGPPVAEREAIAVDPAVLKTYSGVYRMAPEFALTVTVEGDQLMVQATGQTKLPVFAESTTRFFYRAVDAQITFVADGAGKVTKLILHQGGRDQEARRER